MICVQCGREMMVVDLELNDAKDKCRQEFACTNRKCGNFCGDDTSNPCKSAKGDWINI